MPETVLYEVAGAVATITLNRPEQMNTMGDDLIPRTLQSLERAASDDAVRVVVLTGAGRAFCAGGDLQRFASGQGGTVAGTVGLDSRAAQVSALRAAVRSAQWLREMPKITVAAINGACAGAGMSWACACDLRVAKAGARFSVAFRNAGLSGDFGMSWTLPRIVGPGRARELFLLSPRFDAAEAERMGLLARVFEPDAFDVGVAALTAELAAAAPLTLRRIKQNLNDAERMAFSELLDVECERMVAGLGAHENVEAAQAFLEKRKPVFE